MPTEYFLIESNGYYYCTKKKELLTSPEVEVKIQDDVPFKYGGMSGNGKVIFKSGKFMI